MAMPVAGDTVRHSAILDIRGWATAVARASQRYLQLALNHRLDELTHPLTQPDFDRVKPIVEKMDRRLCFRLQDRRRRASLAHGVVSTGAPTPGLLWVSPPGDYAIVNSNHIPDGTSEKAAHGEPRSRQDRGRWAQSLFRLHRPRACRCAQDQDRTANSCRPLYRSQDAFAAQWSRSPGFT